MNGDCNIVYDSEKAEGELDRCPACGVSQRNVKAFDGSTPHGTANAGEHERKSGI